MAQNLYVLFGYQETYYIHELVKRLLEHENVGNVAGLTPHERYHQFLEEQDEVEYEFLHAIPRVHERIADRPVDEQLLKQLERKYGEPSLWPYVLADRNYITYDHRDQQRLIQHWFEFFLDTFDDFDPDLYLAYGIAASPTWIPYVLVRERGGTSISWKSVRVRNRYDLMVNDARDRFRFHALFDRFKNGVESPSEYPEATSEAEQFLEEFRSEDVRPGYFSMPDRSIDLDTIRSTVQLPYKAIRYFIRYNFESIGQSYITDDFTADPTRDLIAHRLSSVYRRARIKYTSVFDEPDYDEDFVFFPLHLEPEAATMLLAPMYIDQPALITQIARSLPINYKLYVKEHPNMLGQRPLSYYDRFDDLSNVKVLHPTADTQTLLQYSDMVTTITGTAGLEALFYGKPVMSFGTVQYDAMEMVYQGGDPEEIAGKLHEGICHHEHDESELVQYLTALFAESFEIPGGDFADSREGARARAEAIFANIEPYLESDRQPPTQETTMN